MVGGKLQYIYIYTSALIMLRHNDRGGSCTDSKEEIADLDGPVDL